MMPSTPCSTARVASSAVRIPFRTIGRDVSERSQAMSLHVTAGSSSSATYFAKAEPRSEAGNPAGLAGLPASERGSAFAKYVAELLDPAVTWRDIAWLRSLTSLPIVLKGILTAEDATLAVEHGVDGIIVSNHGGRQLDSTVGTLDALPDIVAAVQGRVEVFMDGAVRRGTDVLKALALGAKAVLIGRSILWGLALGGSDGVRRVLEHLRGELELAMALTGRAAIAQVDRSLIQRV